MLDATATAEDEKWAALSTELNEQFDRGQKNYAARLSIPHFQCLGNSAIWVQIPTMRQL